LAEFLNGGETDEKPQSLTQEGGKFTYHLKPFKGKEKS
jgi:hypothetical protein